MRELFALLFDFATDPLGLPISVFYEWAIMLVVGEIAYQVAYYAVGKTYATGTEARVMHWTIRFFFYLGAWAAIRAVIWVVRHWQIVLMLTGSVAGAVLLCVMAVMAMRFVRKHKAVNGNA